MVLFSIFVCDTTDPNVHAHVFSYKTCSQAVFLFRVIRADCNIVSLFTCPVDVIQVLNQSLDAQWRHFGTHLCVESAILDSIDKDKSNVGACMLQLVEKWLAHENGTGDLPRTWETVVQAVKKTGKRPLVQILAQCHDVQRKSSEAYEVIKRLQHPPQVRISQGCASI